MGGEEQKKLYESIDHLIADIVETDFPDSSAEEFVELLKSLTTSSESDRRNAHGVVRMWLRHRGHIKH